MKLVGIGLGSNLGLREKFLNSALAAMRENPLFFDFKSSPFYEAQSIGAVGPDYLNAVCVFETQLPVGGVHLFLKQAEQLAGRVRGLLNAPRVLDLDLLFYGSEMIKTPELVVPHPRMPLRAFVLKPLCDVAPDWVHPQTHQTARQMLEALPRNPAQKIKLYENHPQRETLSRNA